LLSISNKFTFEPSFVIDGYAAGKVVEGGQPTAELSRVLEELGVRVITGLEINDSLFSIDVLVCNGKLLVVDVGPLLDAKMDRLLEIAGTDIYELQCHLATGQRILPGRFPPPRTKGYALRFLYSRASGVLEPANGKSLPTRTPRGSGRIEWERRPGDRVGPPSSVADTLGWVMVIGEDRSMAWLNAKNTRPEELFRIRGEK
jgi:biotin carboxylase